MIVKASDVRCRERRRFSRQMLSASCKIRDASGYAPARTADVSAGGCRFVTDRDRRFAEGQEVLVGISLASDAVIEERTMMRGRVRRVRCLDSGEQEVGVEFDWADTGGARLRHAA
jgi:c-di-GMP-binding flagellar brake protein YcgR